MEKLLTIAVPSFNMEGYLDVGMEKLLQAGSKHLMEVIIVNDGSTDHTREIAESHANKYPSVVRVINKPNGHYNIDKATFSKIKPIMAEIKKHDLIKGRLRKKYFRHWVKANTRLSLNVSLWLEKLAHPLKQFK